MCLDAIFCRLFVVAPVVVVLDEARDLVFKGAIRPAGCVV